MIFWFHFFLGVWRNFLSIFIGTLLTWGIVCLLGTRRESRFYPDNIKAATQFAVLVAVILAIGFGCYAGMTPPSSTQTSSPIPQGRITFE